MKKLFIAFGLMIVLLGATISVLGWLEVGPSGKAEKEKLALRQVEEERPRFVDLRPIAIPVFQDDKVTTTIYLHMKLKTVGLDNFTRIGRKKAKIRDAYLRELHTFIPRMLRKTRHLNIDILKARLQMVSDQVMPHGEVRDILVQLAVDLPN